MIEILGVNEGKEFEAATHLKKQILAVWPDLAQSTDDHVKIFVGLKLYGYRIEDIDLVVIGHFAKPRSFAVEYKFYPRDGDPFVPRLASVKNFMLVIEAKSHDASGVKFEDKIASVRYRHGGRLVWESVTEKNRQQMFEFKRYLAEHGEPRVYVQDLTYFSGLRESDLPKRPHNCFGADASFERILNILGQVSAPRRENRDALISFGSDEVFVTILSPGFPLFQTLEPTPLDRRRMDRIAKAAVPETWLDDLGRKQVIIRGRGGVGKTVILLQMAYRAFDRDQLRSLVLTYNKVLVADMRRTMALLGVPRSVENGGIAIDTVHSFVGRLMFALGIIESYDGFLDAYDDKKAVLLDYLRTGAVSAADLEQLIDREPSDFLWDVVFVDEGQDWPEDEIEILRAVYSPERIAVADGVDQFVRSSVADWASGMHRRQIQPHRLVRCLRMKANLAAFVDDFASALQLNDWDLEPNPDAPGGRVLIVEGDLAHSPGVVKRLRREAASLGNYPIDLLACVPPVLVRHESETPSIPGQVLAAAGQSVWDATSIDVRDRYPTDRDALRIVQYDSCRGLEGWTVINYGFDEFWTYKFREYLSGEISADQLLPPPEDRARASASRWAMIPLTRAMDTLVINICGRTGLIREALEELSARRRDFVEWMTV
jgi:hypothetical protein